MEALYPESLGPTHILGHANLLAELGDRTNPDTLVETCGDWTMADLLWHLAEVQAFWTFIITNRPAGPESYERPDRPSDDELPTALRAAAESLATALSSANASEPAWSWSDNHTVEFSIRRQTHEAYIHYIDGVLAAGQSIPLVSSELAADGIDELVNVMLGGLPAWATFTPGVRTVRLVSWDTANSWTLRFGRATGTPPGLSDSIDQPAAMPVNDVNAEPDCTIDASAADLLLWLWGRASIKPLDITGHAELGSQLREIIASETQ